MLIPKCHISILRKPFFKNIKYPLMCNSAFVVLAREVRLYLQLLPHNPPV